MVFKRISAAICALSVGASPLQVPLWAEPLPDSTAAAVTKPGGRGAPPPLPPTDPTSGATASPAAATPGAPAAPGAATTPVREPLIEVSVDSLEISEKSSENLGLSWNTVLNFKERTIPSIFNVGTFDRLTNLQAALNLLIENNQARVLANPTLITKSMFEATFAVGGEIPYPTVGQGGVQGVEYKKYGVILKILPQITARKTIEAQINVTVSNPDAANSIQLAGITVPAIASRDAGSKVEVVDGDTVVLAGIKQSRRDKTIDRVPFFSKIPLIGFLFRNKNEVVTQTSLVIFVTFRLIK
jgi:type II secretory pathway component GspD/PulD (secretin)